MVRVTPPRPVVGVPRRRTAGRVSIVAPVLPVLSILSVFSLVGVESTAGRDAQGGRVGESREGRGDRGRRLAVLLLPLRLVPLVDLVQLRHLLGPDLGLLLIFPPGGGLSLPGGLLLLGRPGRAHDLLPARVDPLDLLPGRPGKGDGVGRRPVLLAVGLILPLGGGLPGTRAGVGLLGAPAALVVVVLRLREGRLGRYAFVGLRFCFRMRVRQPKRKN